VKLLALFLLLIKPIVHAERLNFVLILIDDMGYTDIGPFGQNNSLTPNLNKLAENGTIFTRAQ
jgi:arylsulfatase A-like enzyme